MSLPPVDHTGHRKRLRSRVLHQGAKGLGDYELLEILLFAASARRDTRILARSLIKKFGSLGQVLHASKEQLLLHEGLGEVGVASILVIPELVGRLLQEEVGKENILSSWQSLLNYLRVTMNHLRTEQSRILYLNRKNVLIADEKHGDGGMDEVPMYTREILRRALELEASALVLVHNHPSGDPTPSQADIEATRKLEVAAHGMGIAVHDHVIIGRKHEPVSFKSLGLL